MGTSKFPGNPADDMILIRGGVPKPPEQIVAKYHKPGISLFGADPSEGSAGTLAACTEVPIRNNKIHRTTAGKLREAGWKVKLTMTDLYDRHYTAHIPGRRPNKPNQAQAEAFARAFDAEEANPWVTSQASSQ